MSDYDQLQDLVKELEDEEREIHQRYARDDPKRRVFITRMRDRAEILHEITVRLRLAIDAQKSADEERRIEVDGGAG